MRTRPPALVVAALTVALGLARAAAAEPTTVLRFATAAPDGTAWARLFRAMGRDIDSETQGKLGTKWYFGGIAGSEEQMLQRLKNGQLDAVLSGGMMCMKLSPSMRVLRLLGLFQSREEAGYVLGRLRPIVDEEFAAAGFHNMGEASLGSDMMFSRTPITSVAEMKKARLWFWDLDEPMRVELQALGVPAIGLPVDQASRAYDDKRTDGFLAIPTAALAYQWSAQAQYLSLLRLGFLAGCMVLTNRVWDQLTNDERTALNVAAAKFQHSVEELGRQQDAALIDKLFARQGVRETPVSTAFASEFFERAREARGALRDKMVPGALIDKVTGWLADHRAEFPRQGN